MNAMIRMIGSENRMTSAAEAFAEASMSHHAIVAHAGFRFVFFHGRIVRRVVIVAMF